MRKSSNSLVKQEDPSENATPEISAREKLLNDQPELLQQFGMDLLPVLVQVHQFWSTSHFILYCFLTLGVVASMIIFSTDIWFQCEQSSSS